MKHTLYKRNVNGSINIWSIIIEDDGYYTEYGQLNGKLVTSDKVFVEAKNIGKKNETTIQQQAINEAESILYTKINSENFKENILDIDKIYFNPPMLAKEYKSYNKDIKYVQPKLDGIRCNVFYDNEIKAISRKNKTFYSVDHIKESLREVLISNPFIHIDGELYNHSLHDDFNKIVSLVKKEKVKDEDKENIVKYIRYNIYDIWDDSNPDLTFSQRYNLIQHLFSGLEYIDIVETYEINEESDIEKYWALFTDNGYEGAILRLDKPYEHKRSKNLLKYKKFNEDEFRIIDICEGKIKGYAEYAIVDLGNTTCKATLSMTDKECKNILLSKDMYIGQLATVKYFGYTNDNKLRFPILKSIRNYE